MLSYLLSLLPSRLTFLSGLTSLCSFYLSVISALVPLLTLPVTSQIAFGMYLLFHEWGGEPSDPDYHAVYKLLFHNCAAACLCVR